MTPELQSQLNARIDALVAELTPAQQATVAANGRYQQMPWTMDTGWEGDGTLEFSVTEYFGPSEIDGQNGPGAEGIARYTGTGGDVWILSRDFGTQPSRNRDWAAIHQGGQP